MAGSGSVGEIHDRHPLCVGLAAPFGFVGVDGAAVAAHIHALDRAGAGVGCSGKRVLAILQGAGRELLRLCPERMLGRTSPLARSSRIRAISASLTSVSAGRS